MLYKNKCLNLGGINAQSIQNCSLTVMCTNTIYGY